MAASGLVDCMAHLDLVKIFGYRPTNDFSDVLDAVLSQIHDANLAMELSTAGWRKPVGELYPSNEIIRRAMAKGIPFTTASDGHSHVQQGENFERLAQEMAELGIREVMIFDQHRRMAVVL
jgi:histidinol-phosphatase (PHP family)